ncbi:hypothetical protein SAMN05421663_102483 [Terribacillus halophilus]|uniref:Uncharacterized protein n=1 Tax=Terribacillus halophilus TaxID=361279 RepID=A0A1G6LS23_9BACI|nr:hypothetical protein [Terribacillus halophilus]SDC45991.1 hypothetical protein SAMN05421663_102483 [Terribacillus halophilus]
MRKWLIFHYVAGILAAAEFIYDLVLDGHMNWLYLAILISQLCAIYAMKREQNEQASH